MFDFFTPAVLGSIGSSALSGLMTRSNQNDAQAFSAEQYANRYQTTVEDMKKAGLNPMLAYSQGPGASPQSSGSSVSANDLGAAYSQGKVASAQSANLEADTVNKQATTENIRADTLLKQAQTLFQGASADQARANIGYLETQAKSIAEAMKNIPKEGNRLDALVKNLAEEYKVLQHKVGTQEQAKAQMEWLATKTFYEAGLTKIDFNAAENTGNLGAYSREAKVVLDFLRSFFRK